MFNDPVSFNGDTRVEVIAVLANCGMDTDRARRALVTWIRHKQYKGRSTEHILGKLRDIESKFIKDTSLHSAFRDARAETFLPRAPDLPLPAYLTGRRKSSEQAPESVPFIITPRSTGPGRSSIASSSELPASLTQHTSPLPGRSNAGQRISLPYSVIRTSQSRSPRIQIPRDRPQPGPSSPITSSPEESEIHFRYRYLSHPLGPSSQSNGLHTPVSTSPPEFPLSLISARDQARAGGRSSYGFAPPPPSSRMSIPRSLSQRSAPISPPASSSDESDFHPRRYRPISQPIASTSPGFRRVTPPRTIPPDVPLPPIPSDDQGVDSDSDSSKDLYAEEPPTPMRSLGLYPPAPSRPLPIQPIPSPIPGPDESDVSDFIGEDSLRQDWDRSTGDLPSDIVVRQDSPVYMFHHDHASFTGISPPPPYINQLDTYFPVDMSTMGDSLDRAVKEYGEFSGVRSVVTKCIEFHGGYEPPYWQARLQACGLDAGAAGRLVAEMSKQVDWAATFRRSA